jgi:two-component system, cell cycle response regulator
MEKMMSEHNDLPSENNVKTVESASSQNAGYRALIVDDNAAFLKLLAFSLSMQPKIGVIDLAESGESAIEKAEATQYDLIFMDAMMPGIDGYEACTRLRENPAYKNTPIIMVSGLTSPLEEVKGIIAGSTTYVTKPVQQEPFKELVTRVLVWLEYKKTADESFN